MKKFYTILVSLVIFSGASAQLPIVYYDFENNLSRSVYENAVELSINNGSTAISSNGLNNVGGNNSAAGLYGGSGGKGIGANGWSTSNTDPGVDATDYFQFVVNTTGFYELSVSFDCSRATNGPSKVGVLWSVDGTSFNQAAVVGSNTNSSAWETKTFNLGSSADNQAALIIRIYGYGGNGSHYGYFDNFLVAAKKITGVKTALKPSDLGRSLTSGGSLNPSYGTLIISGAGSELTLTDKFKITQLNIETGAALKMGLGGIMQGNGRIDAAPGAIVKLTSTDVKGALKGSLSSMVVNSENIIVEYAGSALQYKDAEPVAGLVVNNDFGLNALADLNVSGELQLKKGTVNLGSKKLKVKGNITKVSGTINASFGEIVFEGTGTQSVAAGVFSGAINVLDVATAGEVIFSGDESVNTVKLTKGKLAIGKNKLSVTESILKNDSTQTGTIDASLGTIEMAGLANQIISAKAFENKSLKNLRVSNKSLSGVTLEGELNIEGVLDFGAVSNSKFQTNGGLVLKSGPAGTARIADLTNNGSSTGNTVDGLVTVERYFPNNGRRYRMITSGVTSVGSIRDNWMEGGMNTSVCATCNDNPKPGYGTQITGSGGNVNGFDATQTNSASLFTYNFTTGGWTAVTNTNQPINGATPYLIFIRGDRSVDMTAQGTSNLLPGTATILRTTGYSVNSDVATAPLANAGKFSLVSNPFASPVNWSTIHANNSGKFENFYTYWDPKVGTRGAYVTVTTTGIKSNPTVDATTELQTGQAFFVKTKSGVNSPVLNIRQKDKGADNNKNVFRTSSATQQMGISLFFTDGAGQRINADGVTAVYGNDYSTEIDENDAHQIANWDEDLAIARKGQLLSIETRPFISTEDTITIAMARMKVQQYELQINPSSFESASNLTAYLVDQFTNTQTPVSLLATTVVPFSVTSNAASAASNRFMIVFKSATTLPVEFKSVNAYEKDGAVSVDWTTASESNIRSYEVQRSVDGRNFVSFNEQAAKQNAVNYYTAKDASPAKGFNYYRVKYVENNNETKFSKVMVVKIGAAKGEISLVSNHFVNNMVTLSIVDMPQGNYTIALVNSSGQVVERKTIEHVGNTGTYAIQFDLQVSKGIYYLNVSNSGSQITLKMIN